MRPGRNGATSARRRRSVKAGLPLGIVVACGLAAVPFSDAQTSGSAQLAPAVTAAPEVHVITLITGDVVHVSTQRNGRRAVSFEPGPDGEIPDAAISEVGPHLYVIPRAAVPLLSAKSLDLELFDVAALVKQRYDDARSETLPVLVDYGRGPARRRRVARGQPRRGAEDGHDRLARHRRLRGRQGPRARVLALADGRSQRRGRSDGAVGRRDARRPRRARARHARSRRRPDPRAPGLGRRLRRRRHDRRRARHGLRHDAPRPRRHGRGHGQLQHEPDRQRRQRPRHARGLHDRGHRRGLRRRARRRRPGREADDRQGARRLRLRRGLRRPRRHAVGRRAGRRRGQHEPRRRCHRRHGSAQPGGQRALRDLRHAVRDRRRQQRRRPHAP